MYLWLTEAQKHMDPTDPDPQHLFLSLPDPLVTSMDPVLDLAPDPSIIKQK